MAFQPPAEIFLIGKESRSVCEEHGLWLLDKVKCSGAGFPMIDDMFCLAQERATRNVLMYVNADIILANVYETIKVVKAELEEFLVVGLRFDLQYDIGLWKFDASWENRLRKTDQPRLGPPCAADYFLFTKNYWETIPPLVVGHAGWDNWMIEAALKMGKPIVNASSFLRAYHQPHHPRPPGRPDRARNIDLLNTTSTHPKGFVTQASWILTEKTGLKKIR